MRKQNRSPETREKQIAGIKRFYAGPGMSLRIARAKFRVRREIEKFRALDRLRPPRGAEPVRVVRAFGVRPATFAQNAQRERLRGLDKHRLV